MKQIDKYFRKYIPAMKKMEEARIKRDATKSQGTLKWHCNKCGADFNEVDANLVDVAPDSDECMIACPKCWANWLDGEDSLSINAGWGREV
jgi:hypothetical protein